MTHNDVEASRQTYARIGGLIYLIIIVIALFAEAYASPETIRFVGAAT